MFGTIDRSEYAKLFDFVKEHGLKIRNIKGQDGHHRNMDSSEEGESFKSSCTAHRATLSIKAIKTGRVLKNNTGGLIQNKLMFLVR